MAKKQSGRKGRVIRRKSTVKERERMKEAWAEEEAGMEENKARGREVLDERRRLGDAVAVLKSIREQQGITLTAMAERLGMPKGNLSRLENMEGPNPKIGTLEKYAQALGRTIEIAVVET